MGITAFPFPSVIDVPTARILGRDDAGTGAAEALTNTEIFAILGTGTPSASTYLRGDGTWATVSAGISSLNGLTDATQAFAVGTTGTNVAFVSAAGVHTLNIPDASATARGVVTTGTQTIAGAKTLTGVLAANGGSQSAAGIRLNDISFGPYGYNGGWNFVLAAESFFRISTSGIVVQSGKVLAFGNSFNNTGTTQIWEDASHRLAQRNDTNPQAFGVYNTYTSATSFERLNLSWASNVCYIGTEKGSAGGTARDLTLGTDGAVRLVLPAASTSGALYLGPRADNTATGGNARGANAVDFQTIRLSATQIASGATSFVGNGTNNQATGERSFVGNGNAIQATAQQSFVGNGSANTATGLRAAIVNGNTNTATNEGVFIGCGQYNSCTSYYTVICGGSTNIASAPFANVLGGLSGRANRYAMRAFSAGRFVADGDSQGAEMVLRGSTTTNAAVRLRPDNSAERLTIASGQVCQYLLIITGVRDGGADVASYMRQVTIKNIGGTTSIVGTVNTIGVDNAAGTSLSVTADDTNNDLAVEPIGVFNQNWRWTCIAYGGEIGHG